MANVNHSTLTDPFLHEPKGVSTATVGRLYRSDGAGSGSWVHIPSGWGYYQHSGAAQNITTVASKLQINGSGALTNTSYLPREIRGTSQLWDTANHKVTPMKLGDSYDIRLDLPITARTSAVELTVQLDISGAATPTTVIVPVFAGIAKTPPFTIVVTLPVVILSATTLTNGIQLFLSVDAGNIDIDDPSITIVRTHGGDL